MFFIKGPENKDARPKKSPKQIGINIIEKDNVKYYVEWDGTNVDIHTTIEEVWSKY